MNRRWFLLCVLSCWLLPWQPVSAAAAADKAVAERRAAHDSLDPRRESDPAVQEMLERFCWSPEEFEVQWSPAVNQLYDCLVTFPSPIPTGNATNDRVHMLWYAAKDDGGQLTEAPGVVVVHESGASMPVGHLVVRSLQAAGLHALLLELPYYGHRRVAGSEPSVDRIPSVIRQAIADVRRARDAVAVLPHVRADRLAVQGTSLGGFVITLSASLDDAYDGVFIMLAGGQLYDMVTQGQRDTATLRRRLEEQGFQGERLRQLLWQIEPTRLAHRLNPKTTWLYSADQDNVVPLQCALAFAQACALGWPTPRPRHGQPLHGDRALAGNHATHGRARAGPVGAGGCG